MHQVELTFSDSRSDHQQIWSDLKSRKITERQQCFQGLEPECTKFHTQIQSKAILQIEKSSYLQRIDLDQIKSQRFKTQSEDPNEKKNQQYLKNQTTEPQIRHQHNKKMSFFVINLPHRRSLQ